MHDPLAFHFGSAIAHYDFLIYTCTMNGSFYNTLHAVCVAREPLFAFYIANPPIILCRSLLPNLSLLFTFLSIFFNKK